MPEALTDEQFQKLLDVAFPAPEEVRQIAPTSEKIDPRAPIGMYAEDDFTVIVYPPDPKCQKGSRQRVGKARTKANQTADGFSTQGAVGGSFSSDNVLRRMPYRPTQAEDRAREKKGYLEYEDLGIRHQREAVKLLGALEDRGEGSERAFLATFGRGALDGNNLQRLGREVPREEIDQRFLELGLRQLQEFWNQH